MDTNTIGVGCGGGYQSIGDTFNLIGPGGVTSIAADFAVTPEPSTIFLLGSGLAALGASAWRRRAPK